MKNEIQKTEYLLAPGYIIVPEDPTLIYMILGSSVSVVIFNRKKDTKSEPSADHIMSTSDIKSILSSGQLLKYVESNIGSRTQIVSRSSL